MSLKDFPALDIEPIDNINIRRGSLKFYHQQRANLKDPDQNVEFIFGQNDNHHQIGNSYLEFDITVRRDDKAIFTVISAIRMTNNAFVYVFKETRLSTTSGGDLEHNKIVCQLF